MTTREDLAARKELLMAQADLTRIQLALAWHDLTGSIFPSTETMSSYFVPSGKTAAFLVGIAAPLVGRSRFARWLRYGSIAMAIVRAARSLRR
jgi:hypothetical protein